MALAVLLLLLLRSFSFMKLVADIVQDVVCKPA